VKNATTTKCNHEDAKLHEEHEEDN